MDPFVECMLSLGVRGFIGKGRRGDEVRSQLLKHGAVYFASFGGAAAYLSTKIEQMEVLAFEDLGPEAVFRLRVKDFPLIVINDTHGGDAYEASL
jgi:fumarate hydratase subunit beta